MHDKAVASCDYGPSFPPFAWRLAGHIRPQSARPPGAGDETVRGSWPNDTEHNRLNFREVAGLLKTLETTDQLLLS